MGPLVLVGLSVAASVTAVAHAQTTTQPSGPHTCGTKRVSVLFWPAGHPASSQFNFPEYLVPHVEVYLGTSTTYGDPDFLAYFDNRGNASYSPACTMASAGAAAKAVKARASNKIPKEKTITDKAVVTCKLKKKAVLDVVADGSEATMSITAGKKLEATIEVGASVGSVAYDSKRCTVEPAIA